MAIKYKTGPRSHLEEDLIQSFIESINKWVPIKIFTAAKGVSYRNFARWMAKGLDDIEKEEGTEYADFYIRINEAYENRVSRNAYSIEAASDKFWQGKAWLLERSHQSSFSLQAGEMTKLQEDIKELKEVLSGKINSSEAKENTEE